MSERVKLRSAPGGAGAETTRLRMIRATLAAFAVAACSGAQGDEDGLLLPQSRSDAGAASTGVSSPGRDAGTGQPSGDGSVNDATVPVAVASDAAVPYDAPPPAEGGLAADSAPPATPACTPATPANLDDCASLAKMTTIPRIDGTLDCGIPSWPMPMVASFGNGLDAGAVEADVAAAWRPEGLYLYVRVRGAGPVRSPPPAGATGLWCGDAIEVFVDDNGIYANAPLYDDPGTVQLVVSSPDDAGAPASVGEMYRNLEDLGAWKGNFVTVRTSDGFAVEAFIVAADLGLGTWSLAAGGHVGLDVSVDLGSPSALPATCPRLAQFTIQLPDPSSGACVAACDVNEFCAPQLR
jgi:hypothetical protein